MGSSYSPLSLPHTLGRLSANGRAHLMMAFIVCSQGLDIGRSFMLSMAYVIAPGEKCSARQHLQTCSWGLASWDKVEKGYEIHHRAWKPFNMIQRFKASRIRALWTTGRVRYASCQTRPYRERKESEIDRERINSCLRALKPTQERLHSLQGAQLWLMPINIFWLWDLWLFLENRRMHLIINV